MNSLWLQFKNYIIVSAVSVLVTLVSMMMWNHHQLKSLENINEGLKKDKIVIVDQLTSNQNLLNRDIEEKNKLTLKFEESEKELEKAKKVIASLKQVQPVEREETPKEVQDKIAVLYQDSSTTFANDRFSIFAPTTYSMLQDAENWKVNGPILTTNIMGYKSGWEKANLDLDNCRNLSNQKDVEIQDRVSREVLHLKLVDNGEKQINNLNKELKVEKKSATLKFIEGLFAGAAAYYAQDKLRKK